MRHLAADPIPVTPPLELDDRALPTAPLDRVVDVVQRVGPTATDLLLVSCTLAFALVDFAVWVNDPVVDTGRLAVSIAVMVPGIGAAAVVAVVLRRRFATTAMTVLACASIAFTSASLAIGSSMPPSFAALFALGILTVVVVRREPSGPAVRLAGLAGLAVAAEASRPMVAAAVYLLVAAEGALAVAVCVGLYLRWTDWRRLAAEEAARTNERLELARELHDLVGHHVSGIVVRAQAARHVAERQPAAATAALQSIETAGQDALDAMRQMVVGLRRDTANSAASGGSGWDDIDRLLADAASMGAPLHATIDPAVRDLSPSLAPSVHRIIAEAVTNVRRHASAVTRLDISVVRVDDRLVVTVRDDGTPAGSSRRGSFGIIGMRERAAALGGSLIAGPARGGGWMVRAELPIGHLR